MKGIPAKDLVRQGFWNGVGNFALGAILLTGFALLTFLIPKSAISATTRAKTTGSSCAG